MTTNPGPIKNPSILVKPSPKLIDYIKKLDVTSGLPLGISQIVFKNPVKSSTAEPVKVDYLLSPEDREFIKSVTSKSNKTSPKFQFKFSSQTPTNKLLTLQDLHWLYQYINENNSHNDKKIYLHELIKGSEIILPHNQEIPRSPELEIRCRKLKAEQENKVYNNMTKNVDCIRKKYPEDTLAYQMKLLNSHLIAIFQFIVSVAAGFVFGFLGVELLIGSLDFGFRLLLGIIFGLIIALAELYFLAKKLNQDLQYEYTIETQQKQLKVD